MNMNVQVSTNLLVAARGHDVLPSGELINSASNVARVAVAAEYFHANREAFDQAMHDGTGGVMVMSGGYPTMATGRRIAPPPFAKREGSLMRELAIDEHGVPPEFVEVSTTSTTTLEVVLRPYEEGHFQAVSRDNPLGSVTQISQEPRLRWFEKRIYRLPDSGIVSLIAPGEDDPAIIHDEDQLLRITKLVSGAAHTPAGLRRGERVMDYVSRGALALHLVSPPANKYLSNEAS